MLTNTRDDFLRSSFKSGKSSPNSARIMGSLKILFGKLEQIKGLVAV